MNECKLQLFLFRFASPFIRFMQLFLGNCVRHLKAKTILDATCQFLI